MIVEAATMKVATLETTIMEIGKSPSGTWPPHVLLAAARLSSVPRTMAAHTMTAHAIAALSPPAGDTDRHSATSAQATLAQATLAQALAAQTALDRHTALSICCHQHLLKAATPSPASVIATSSPQMQGRPSRRFLRGAGRKSLWWSGGGVR